MKNPYDIFTNAQRLILLRLVREGIQEALQTSPSTTEKRLATLYEIETKLLENS